MAKQYTIATKVTADASGFKKGIGEAEKSAKGFGGGLGKLSGTLKMMGGAAVIGGVVKGLFSMASELGNAADRLLDLEQITNISTDKLQEYQYVAKMAGVNTEAIATAAQGMTRRLAGATTEASPLNIALKELGISARDSAGNIRNGGDIVEEVIEQLADMQNITERNVLGAQIFGGAWKDLAPILAMGTKGIEAAKKEARDLGVVMSKDSLNAANEYRKSVERLNTTWDVLKREMMEGVIPVLDAVVTSLTEIITVTKKAGAQVDLYNQITNENTKGMVEQTNAIMRQTDSWGVLFGALLRGEDVYEAAQKYAKDFNAENAQAMKRANEQVKQLINEYDEWIKKQIEAGRAESKYVQAAIDVRNQYATTLGIEAAWLEYITKKKTEEQEIVKEEVKRLGLIEGLKTRIAEAEERYQKAATQKGAAKQLQEIEKLKTQLEEVEFQIGKMANQDVWANLGATAPAQMNSLATEIGNVSDEMVIATRTAEDWVKALGEVTEQTGATWEASDQMKNAVVDAAYSIGAAMGKMAQDGGDSTNEIINQMLAQTISFLIAQAIEEIPYPYNIAAAAVSGAIGSGLFGQITNFADGGIAYGEVMGRMGEYSNARSNPEVIAPLDKLKGILGDVGGGGTYDFVIKGNNLIGVLQKEQGRRNTVGK
jgi:hypothetical protein